MTKQLTTQNATITTVAIEIKAITIGSKQVTLSVFRQLEKARLIAHDGTLNGVPWGYVNYHPDKCADDYPHRHIVWQQGQELRRANVSHQPDFDPGVTRHRPLAFESVAVSRYLTSSVLEWLSGRRPDCPLNKEQQHGTKYSDEITYRTPHTFPAWGYADALAVAAANAHAELTRATEWLQSWETHAPDADPEWRERDRQRRLERLDEAQAAHDAACAELAAQVATFGRTHDELLAEFQATCNQEAARRQRHRDVYTSLAQLPQLFIAV
ncbi:hypothetical protein OHA61_34190 [Streptomyces sp. NBC_00885]|uniref:hypothetical protein n=1 Tax=Streptomyces sp. NBC_00885 TaxID=2975857 RepID=UPI00386A9EA3|nr:hypothetical protein OHA61_34190 [Streptomyces sp. NBC_00885]